MKRNKFTCSKPSTVASSFVSSTPMCKGSFLKDNFAKSSVFGVKVAENKIVCLFSVNKKVSI